MVRPLLEIVFTFIFVTGDVDYREIYYMIHCWVYVYFDCFFEQHIKILFFPKSKLGLNYKKLNEN